MIELPFPHKSLWPNGRANYHAKGREAKKHRTWAYTAMKASLPAGHKHDGSPVRLRATFYAKPTGVLPDRDNCSASLKAYQDGIADALGMDDRHFGQPIVHVIGRCANGKVLVEVEPV